MRNVIIVFLSVALCFCAANKAMGQVASGTTGACIWTLTGTANNYTLTISGNGAMGDYYNTDNIPWFQYSSNGDIKTVVIQQGVTSIGRGVFAYCIGLTLTSLTIPGSVTSIGQYAFQDCSGLTGALNIPNSITFIDRSAFLNCTGLTSVTIPSSIIGIDQEAFKNCTNLATVNFNARNCILMGNSTTYTVFKGCSSLSTLNIGNHVQTIPNFAFSGCSGLTGITIPDSVTSIGNYAFSWCSSLTSLTIPNTVTTIGESAFRACSGLLSVDIPNSEIYIGAYAFQNCIGLTSLTIPPLVSAIGNGAFKACTNLTTVNFNAINCAMGFINSNPVFSGCSSFSTLNIGNQVQTIPNFAFSDCIGLTGITIPGSVTSIGESAFYGCSGLTSVTIPSSVTTIGESAFLQSGLTSITIPNSITEIEYGTFGECRNLSSVTIPNSVTEIGSAAFAKCSGLSKIYVKAQTPPSISYTSFLLVPTTIPVFIPCQSISAYQSSSYWNSFTNFQCLPYHTYSVTICEGSSYSDNNFPTPITEAGTYTVSYPTASEIDSVVELTLTYYPENITNYSATIQSGSSYTDDNFPTPITQEGIHCVTFTNVHGCDSTVCLTLSFEKIPATLPWFCNFSNHTERENWFLDNGVCVNKWTMEGELNYGGVISGKCLSITNDNLHNQYTITSPSVVVASRRIISTGADSYTLEFDFQCAGESTYDFVKIFMFDEAVSSLCVSSTNPGSTVFSDKDYAGSIEIYDPLNSSYPYILNGYNGISYTTATRHISAYVSSMGEAGNVQRLFVVWRNDNSIGNQPPAVLDNISLIPVASSGMYYVAATTGDIIMGTVTGSGEYAANSNATITAIPNPGYRFVRWDDNNTQNPRTITVTQNITITAIFELDIYHVSLYVNKIDRGTVTGDRDYVANSVATIEAIPNPTYRFVAWIDGNKDNPRTVVVTQDTTFRALFGIENMHYVYAAPNDSTMGSVTGSDDYAKSGTNSNTFQAEYAPNSVATIKAIPNAGYRFIRWNDANTENPRSFTVVEDVIFTAIFDEETDISTPEASMITLYPNPATEHITIILPDNVPQALFTLYDMQGKVLIRKEIGNQAEISIAHLAAAMYIYNIVSGTASYNGKLRIEN